MNDDAFAAPDPPLKVTDPTPEADEPPDPGVPPVKPALPPAAPTITEVSDKPVQLDVELQKYVSLAPAPLLLVTAVPMAMPTLELGVNVVLEIIEYAPPPPPAPPPA